MRILPIHTVELFNDAVERAANLLRAGQVVAVPTETVYGLAANALDAEAVQRIFEIKGRPANNPIIVHVAGIEMARHCAREWPGTADKLAGAFWPGPLTLVLPRAESIPDIVTAGGDTVGIRWPQHPFMQGLIQKCGFPLAAPSANPSSAISPTTAQHVALSLGEKVPLIIDGGASNVGIESTVVDLTASPPRILRPGMIGSEALGMLLGEVLIRRGEESIRAWQEPRPVEDGLRSPGLLAKHYAPKARLMVLSWRDEKELKCQIEAVGLDPATTHVIAYAHIPSSEEFARISVIPNDPEAFARALYAELHKCDELGAKTILVEQVPDTPEWAAISDRLRRASASQQA